MPVCWVQGLQKTSTRKQPGHEGNKNHQDHLMLNIRENTALKQLEAALFPINRGRHQNQFPLVA